MDQGEEGTQQFVNQIENTYDGVHDGFLLQIIRNGSIRECNHKITGVKCAVNCIDLALVPGEEQLERLRANIRIMRELEDHPNILRLEEVYESTDNFYLVYKSYSGGDLFEDLDEQMDWHFSEEKGKGLVKQMLNGIKHLHDNNILHGDLKLESFAIKNKGNMPQLKLIVDFFRCETFTTRGDLHFGANGGIYYNVSPEMITGGYDERCDLWSLGVMTYMLLSGETPFGGDGIEGSQITVRDNIIQCRYSFEHPGNIWKNISALAKDFIKHLLDRDINKRFKTIENVLDHVWVKEYSH